MNSDTVKGHWKEIKGELKHQWGKFSDDDIAKLDGTTQGLLGAVQKKYGYGKDEAKREINEFLESHGWTNGESMMHKVVEEVKGYTKEAQETVTDYVAENPFKALGIAALVGAALALLIRR